MAEIPADIKPLSEPSASTSKATEQNANIIANRFAGEGWIVFGSMTTELGWNRAQTNTAIRWLRKESAQYVVESKISRGVAKVRITQVALEDKHARQISTDITSLLAKVYIYLKHSERNRHRLAYDLRTIAIRLSPYLDELEFRAECKRYLVRIQKNAKDGLCADDVIEESIDYETEHDHGLEIPSPLETSEPDVSTARHVKVAKMSISIKRILLLGPFAVLVTILYYFLW